MNNLEPNAPMANMPKEPAKSSWGPVIGLVIILILIVAGSFYFFVGDDDKLPTDQSEEPSVADIEADLSKLQDQSDSDKLEDIEKDLENTDLSDLDAEADLAGQEISELDSEL